MSTEEPAQDVKPIHSGENEKEMTSTSATNTDTTRKRPRLELTAEGGRERKRGKSMFGLVVGTLNKAKIEDKERNASEAAKKRQLLEQRLQNKLKKETDSVRRAEEAKKDKTNANRKEEDLQLKDSIYKLRRQRLPLLANFLLTSDVIPDTDDTDKPASSNPLAPPPRSHPPPLYYLPAILTPLQEAFLAKRKEEVKEAAEKEWNLFREERTTGIAEIQQLRQRVVDEETRKKGSAGDEDAEMETSEPAVKKEEKSQGESMDVDDGPESSSKDTGAKEKVKEESAPPAAPMQADDDDAVEY
ncbi:hypothetical protein V5O48_009497 [Marasmius crinis-equi]|uniref:Pinin/SDK/MemA protein domain-containing protein n=1 Tax=Marasmius crinis-equi TaxID=585013 RepID=A0ABR3FBA2_9AGAR